MRITKTSEKKIPKFRVVLTLFLANYYIFGVSETADARRL